LVRQINSVASQLDLTPYGGEIEGEDVPNGWPQESFHLTAAMARRAR